MKTVIEMAREANRYADTHADSTDCDWPIVRDERFAELVRSDEREAIIQEIPGGYSVDPQWVCDMIRARSNT